MNTAMTPLEVVKQYEGTPFLTDDGDSHILTPLPPLTEAEIAHLEAKLGCDIPDDYKALLRYTRGFDPSPIESLRFDGLDVFEYPELFSRCLTVGHDGFGNFWVIDLAGGAWEPIYFVCHDPPVVVYQAPSLAQFIEQVMRQGQPPFTSEIYFVHEEAVMTIWDDNPNILTWDQCMASGDLMLQAFAQTLDTSWLVSDLRQAQVGDGVCWGRYGPRTPIRRYQNQPIFAYQQRKSWLARFFGR